MVHSIPITKARINLGQLAKRAHINKEYFILEKDGIPVIGIMDIDEFEDYLELQDPTLKKRIRQSFSEYKKGKAKPARDFLSQLRAPKKK